MNASDQERTTEPLVDDPDIVPFELARGGTAADLTRRLMRIRRLDETLSWLCREADDLCLPEIWGRFTGAEEDVRAAIEAARSALATIPSDDVPELTARREADG